MTAAPSRDGRRAPRRHRSGSPCLDRTPYHHRASVRGEGTDCLGLVRGVWRAVDGRGARAPSAYAAELGGGVTHGDAHAAAGRHLVPVQTQPLQPADVLLFRFRAHLPAKHWRPVERTGADDPCL